MSEKLTTILEKTGKPYGGHIHNCEFFEITHKGTKYELATGDLHGDPRNRFGFRGNFGMRTSYIVDKGDGWIETRNTVYRYSHG